MNGLLIKYAYYIRDGYRPLMVTLLILFIVSKYYDMEILYILTVPLFISFSILGCLQIDGKSEFFTYLLATPYNRKYIVFPYYIMILILVISGVLFSNVLFLISIFLSGNNISSNICLINLISIELPLLFWSVACPIIFYNKSLKFDIAMSISSLLFCGLIYGLLRLYTSMANAITLNQYLIALLFMIFVVFAISMYYSNRTFLKKYFDDI